MLGLLHLAALPALLPLPLPFWLKLMLAAAIAASCFVSFRNHVSGVSGRAIRELILKPEGTLEVMLGDGSRFEASVGQQSTLWPWLIVLLIERPGGLRPRPLIILPDTLQGEDQRWLRSWLRWVLI